MERLCQGLTMTVNKLTSEFIPIKPLIAIGIGLTQKEDRECGVDQQHIFDRMEVFLAAITARLLSSDSGGVRGVVRSYHAHSDGDVPQRAQCRLQDHSQDMNPPWGGGRSGAR